MKPDIQKEIAALNGLSIRELQDRYADVFGHATFSKHRQHLIKRVAWGIQAKNFGDISGRARQRAEEIADEKMLRVRFHWNPEKPKKANGAPVLLPGTVLTREYQGKTVQVLVAGDGKFLFQEKQYKSLSAIAREVTGKNWNGFVFFRLKKPVVKKP